VVPESPHYVRPLTGFLTNMQIGPYSLPNNVIAAPMAGVSDKPFRQVCRQNGAGMVVSEMVTSNVELAHTTKTRFRLDHHDEPDVRVIQIVGTDPKQLAQAAQFNVDNGAQIIDINMGCPAKKVCKQAAGSALLANEPLVEQILESVVRAVDVPVTVKIRTGSDPLNRNGVAIAQIAQACGVSAITVHGRTRQCKFVGEVEYNTISEIKKAVSIPVIANGDICTPEQAKFVLDTTSADAVMIGRAAQGKPWLFAQIVSYLESGSIEEALPVSQKRVVILDHIASIHLFYGERLGIKFARKHIKWYLQHWDWTVPNDLRLTISTTESCSEQLQLLELVLSDSFNNDSISEAA